MIKFIEVDEKLKKEWMKDSIWSDEVNEEVIRIHNGFSIIAKVENDLAGIISVYYKNLQLPLQDIKEAYIDNIEVKKTFRKQGIATALITEAVNRLENVYQIRSWSSEDKKEMIQLWKKLNFTLNPVTLYPKGNKVNGFFVSKCLKK